ncbi:uncharacterized protein LOC124889637 [Capsicum annuum]|uniref:uncharacterized protein LOC124889637 n=1 Tax=Capsicum annuum TaxID=4072 RepID=UPI001FB17EFE|nr:uncharacterized protein LOC124889637 [Capsicum annuum]
MRKFTSGLCHALILESKVAFLIKDMNISTLVVYAQQMEEEKKKKAKISERKNKKFRYPNQGGGDHHSQYNSGFRAPRAQPQDSRAQSAPSYPPCRLCGQVHHGVCEERRNTCFKCGQISHLQRNYPFRVSSRANKIHVAIPSTPAPKGAASASGSGTGRNHLYALATHHDSEASPNVVFAMKN